MTDGGADLAFLGEEFLTWLWFRLETDGGEFDVRGTRIAVAIDDFLAFAPHESDATEQSLRKGMPTRTAEARAALRSGCRLRKAKLIVADGDEQWTLTLDAAAMNLLGVRLPEDVEAESPRDLRAARIAGFVAIHEIIGGLYELFLSDRLRPEYLATTGAAQAQWMAG